jgi:hypothetical protein
LSLFYPSPVYLVRYTSKMSSTDIPIGHVAQLPEDVLIHYEPGVERTKWGAILEKLGELEKRDAYESLKDFDLLCQGEVYPRVVIYRN